MKTNDLPANSLSGFNGSNVSKELDQFNRRRAARGLLPVTVEEFAELSLKIMGFGAWNNLPSTVH